MRDYRFPLRHQASSDGLEATVFIGAFLTLVIVAIALFYEAPWVPLRTNTSAANNVTTKQPIQVSKQSIPTQRPSAAKPTAVPTVVALVIQTTPVPTVDKVPVSTETPVLISPTPFAAPTVIGRVANTGGDGVFLRHTPVLSDRWVAWPDDTPLIVLGREADSDGQHWVQVQDPKKNVGWIPMQYLTRSAY